MKEKLNYTEAYEELQQIVDEMERAEVTIDQLDEKIKRAAELLKICRAKLFDTEKSVTDVLKTLETELDQSADLEEKKMEL